LESSCSYSEHYICIEYAGLCFFETMCTLVCRIPHCVLNGISFHSKPFPFTAVVKYLVTGSWSHLRQAICEDGHPVFWKLSVSPSFISHFVNPFHPDTTKCLDDISLAVEDSRLCGQGKQSLLRLIPEHVCVCVCVCTRTCLCVRKLLTAGL
jgi:hypothetical protein